VSGAILLAILFMALAAPLIAPHDPYAHDLSQRLLPPIFYPDHDSAHPLGTDGFGRDYLSRLIYGARISLIIGFSVMLISGLIGTSLGLVAGYFGGPVDQAIMFVINTRLALPIFLVAMSIVVVFGPSLTGLILTLGLFHWDRFVVIVRSATQQAASQDYVTAARSIGCSSTYILLREILPNIANAIIIIGTIEMAYAILVGAALSFLGFGVQEPTPSWGLMLAQARQFIFFEAWLLYIPGAALFILVLAINLFGDCLRDLLGAEDRA
jgi:peptide/nickel transport system permease protein